MDTATVSGTQPAGTAARQQRIATARGGAAADLQEMIREAREKAQDRRDALQPKTPKQRYGDAPIEACARLARARTPAEVSAASSFARRKIAQLRSALHQDSASAEQIRSAIRQLQKAVVRGNRKRQDLQREKLAEVRRAKAQEEQKRRKAQQIRHELARSRAARAIRESGYVREVVIDSQLQSQLAAAREDLQSQAQGLASACPPQSGQYGPDGSMTGGEAAVGAAIDLQA